MRIKIVLRHDEAYANGVIDANGCLEVTFAYPAREVSPRNLSEKISSQYGLHKLMGRCKIQGVDIFFDKYGVEDFYRVSRIEINGFPGPRNYIQGEFQPVSEGNVKLFLVPDLEESKLDYYLEKGDEMTLRHDVDQGWVSVEFVDQNQGLNLAWIADTAAVVIDDNSRLCGFRFVDVASSGRSKFDEIDDENRYEEALFSRIFSRIFGRA